MTRLLTEGISELPKRIPSVSNYPRPHNLWKLQPQYQNPPKAVAFVQNVGWRFAITPSPLDVRRPDVKSGLSYFPSKIFWRLVFTKLIMK